MARKKRPSAQQPAGSNPSVSGTLRVIGGSLRGRPIAYSGDPRTRPMKQRVREAVFNLVGNRVVGAHVLDLFAGSGALAWEALSRGAAWATLVERHFPTVRLLHENAASLGLTARTDIVAGDTFIWAPQLVAAPPLSATAQPWLVFCAPPYDLYVDQTPTLMALLTALADRAPRQSVFVVEADERFDPANLPTFCPWDVRDYPPARVALGEIGQQPGR